LPTTARDRIDRLFCWLVTLYPLEFRERFGTEMIELFRSRRRRAPGAIARARLTARMAVDASRSIARERRLLRLSVQRDRATFMSTLADDGRAAARFLRRAPGLAAAIVTLMALAIGATTVVFGIVNAVLLTPPPFGEPDRIVMLWEHRADTSDHNPVSGHEFPEWEQRAHTFERMAAIAWAPGVNMTGAGEPVSLLSARVTSGFFDVMGVPPELGRGFRPAEDVPGQGDVVVLSDRLWRERFGADPNVLNRAIALNDRAFTIVGVMPATFTFPVAVTSQPPDIWTPIAEPIHTYRGRHFLAVVARINRGVAIETARADLAAVANQLEAELGDLNKGHRTNVVPLAGDLVRDSRSALLLLFGGVGCLLLIGCTNVAGLLVARGIARRREFSLHLALGATRSRVIRRLLLESLLLAVAGGALGVALAIWLMRLVPALLPSGVLPITEIAPDARVLAFALGASVLTGLLFGLAPALQLRHFGLSDVLKRGGRTMAGDAGPRLRRALVAGQIALAVILVLGAALMMRGLVALHRVDPGFRTDGILSVNIVLPAARYRDASNQRRFFSEFQTRVAALPGVTSVGGVNSVPLSGTFSGISIDVEGRPAPKAGQDDTARYRVVSPGYFKTMAIPIVEGRAFTESDARRALPLIRWWEGQPLPREFDAPQPMPVAVVNQTLARAMWANQSPIGRRFKVLFSPWITVVGVAADTRNDSLRDRSSPEFYLADSQEPQLDFNLMARTAGAPMDLSPAVRSIVRELDPGLPIRAMGAMDDIVGRTFAMPRFLSALLGLFGGMALLLMAAGVYGLIVFTVSQRMPEMGVRVALGAGRRQVFRLILRDGLLLAVTGVLIGAGSAALLGQVVGSEVFGLRAALPSTLAAVLIVILAVVVAACWLPARRAAQVDPAIVLRDA